MLRRLFRKGSEPERTYDEPLPAPPSADASPSPPGESPTLPWGSMVQVVGESHYAESFHAICGPPNKLGYSVDALAELRPEPENPYDPNAVAVFVQGQKVGHLSREDARRYETVVRGAIAEHGTATCYAAVHGGWGFSEPDVFLYWVRLRFSDRAWQVAPVGPDEVRLPSGGPVSVSHEEEYQDTLIDALAGSDLSFASMPTLAELVPAPRDPHLKKDSGKVLEVRVKESTVGFLTEAMSDRYLPTVEAALAAGKRVTAEASLFAGTKKGNDIIEVRLHAATP